MLKIRTKQRPVKKGFDPHKKERDRLGWRYVAIELNHESWETSLDDSEILDVLEIHHLAIAPVTSTKDSALIRHWSNQISSVYLAPCEFLAEIYVTQLNDHALAIGANVGRIYHNSHLGDTRIHGNSLGHVFEPSEGAGLPKQVIQVMRKYTTLEHVADGRKITLKNRLGV